MTDDPGPATYPCANCGGPTFYQLGSGGREWTCTACGATGEYDLDAPSLPRAVLLQTEEGRVALRAQMDQHLAELREQPPSDLPP